MVYSAAATTGVGKIEGGTNACDHGLSFKSHSRATPCISRLKKTILLESPDKGTPQRSLGDSNGAPKMFLQSDLSQLV